MKRKRADLQWNLMNLLQGTDWVKKIMQFHIPFPFAMIHLCKEARSRMLMLQKKACFLPLLKAKFFSRFALSSEFWSLLQSCEGFISGSCLLSTLLGDTWETGISMCTSATKYQRVNCSRSFPG